MDPEKIAVVVKIHGEVEHLANPQGSFRLTAREVSALRKAYVTAVDGLEPSKWPQEVKECDSALCDLEDIVRDDIEAQSGDIDKKLKGKSVFAPIKIPARRRLQTFVVSLFLFFTVMPACTIITILALMNPFTMPPMVAYLLWIFFAPIKHPMPRQRWWARHIFFRMYRDYFPIRLVASKEARAQMDPKRNYLFCYHPHGVHSFGAMINFGSDANLATVMFPGLKFHLQTLKINFYVPFWRHTLIWGGAGDASAGCIRKTLSAGPGECAVLVVGGAEESMMASPKTNDLTLSKRKGFVKIALQTGAALVPVFGFGETNVYDNLADGRPWLRRLMKKVQKTIGFALPLVSGRGYFTYSWGILPHRRPIVTVVGCPLILPKIEKPTQEDVDKWHKKYCEALMELYHENKSVYDVMPKSSARIVS